MMLKEDVKCLNAMLRLVGFLMSLAEEKKQKR
jgi:hypothetical protein